MFKFNKQLLIAIVLIACYASVTVYGAKMSFLNHFRSNVKVKRDGGDNLCCFPPRFTLSYDSFVTSTKNDRLTTDLTESKVIYDMPGMRYREDVTTNSTTTTTFVYQVRDLLITYTNNATNGKCTCQSRVGQLDSICIPKPDEITSEIILGIYAIKMTNIQQDFLTNLRLMDPNYYSNGGGFCWPIDMLLASSANSIQTDYHDMFSDILNGSDLDIPKNCPVIDDCLANRLF